MVNSALPKGEEPLPTRVRANCSNSWEAASAKAWASCLTSCSCCSVNGWLMAAPRIARVDFLPERLLPKLCTKIPPSIQTPTPRFGWLDYLLDDGRAVGYGRESLCRSPAGRAVCVFA